MTGLILVQKKYNKHGLAALAGALERTPPGQGFAVLFSPEKDLPRTLWEGSRLFSRLIAAFSFHTPNTLEVAAHLRKLKEFCAGLPVPVIFLTGGPHPSGDPEGTLLMGFDMVLAGEGEEILPRLLRQMAAGQSIEDLPGLAFLQNGKLIANPRPPLINLDDYPPFSARYNLFAPVELSRGCPWGCRFCQTPFLMGHRMRHRSLNRVIGHLETGRAHGLQDLRFVTPNAFAYLAPDGRSAQPAAVETLLLEAGRVFGRSHVYFGSFPSEVRADSVTPELVQMVKTLAANDNVVIGAQSGSDRLLSELHRGHDTGQVIQAVEWLRRAGFRVYVDFIFGLPGELPADREQTRLLIKRLAGMGATIHGHSFIPLPGSPLGNAPPPRLDEETRQLLLHLAGKGNHCGQWRKQEAGSHAVTQFMDELKNRRPPESPDDLPPGTGPETDTYFP